jgi:CAAX prenyl protease-like protein
VLIHPDFEKVELGEFGWLSFVVTVLLFGFEHYHWVAGIGYGLLMNGLIYWTRRLWPCIIAHAVTNLGLGVYVLVTRDWIFW